MRPDPPNLRADTGRQQRGPRCSPNEMICAPAPYCPATPGHAASG